MSTIRFLVLSDTHDMAFPDPSTLPKVDVVLHCGDLTQVGALKQFNEAAKQLGACDAELKLVIPGNHDLDLDPVWWAKELDDDDDPDLPAKAAALFGLQGVRLLDEGVHTITLKDGRSFRIYASPYTPKFQDYAFAYGPDEDRFNSGKTPIPDDGVDIVMTHGPPSAPDLGFRLAFNFKNQPCGCPKLWKVIARSRPRLHCFGHIHEGYGVQTVDWTNDQSPVFNKDKNEHHVETPQIVVVPPKTAKQTVLLNAAVLARGDRPNNTPFVVDMVIT